MKDSAEFVITRRILRLSNLLINSTHEELVAFDLTYIQAEALLFFHKNIGAKALDLKEYFNISHQAARSIVERLCKKNYLYTQVSQKDGRAKQVFCTEEGDRICRTLKDFGNNDGQNLLQDVSEEDKARLLTLLQQMIHNINV